MAIRKLKAARTHYPNFGVKELNFDETDMSGVNHGIPADVLIAPDRKNSGFSTHKTQASAKKQRLKATSLADLDLDDANLDYFEDEDILDSDPVFDFDEDADDLDEDFSDEEDLDIDVSDLDDEDFDSLDDDFIEATDLLNDDVVLDNAGDSQLIESMDLVDVDDIPEEVEEEDIILAPVESSVLVIYKDRVIAKMTLAEAEEEGVEDEYESDEFADVVASVCASKGLRRGLSEVGFKLTKVNIGASHVVKAAVEKKTKVAKNQLTASSRKKERALNNCLALASVGINRNFWKDAENPLKAALETTLLQAGLTNPRTTVNRIFAQEGLTYAKTLLAKAVQLADMPAETRKVLAEALNMTSDDYEDEDTEYVEEAETEDIEDSDVDFADIEASSIEQVLASPMRKSKGALLTPKTPVTARTILNSSDILEF